MCNFGVYLIKQKLQHSQEDYMIFMNKLRHVLKSGLIFNEINNMGQLMVVAEERMQTGMNSLQCFFYQVQNDKKLTRF